jgi:SAM-dependent methyltransferase
LGIHLSVVMPVFNERYVVAEAVRRLLALDSELIDRLDLIVVDDGSTDGSVEIVRGLALRQQERLTLIEHERNLGKGAALRTGIRHARGTVTLFCDADLEYMPRDIPRLLVPVIEEGADAVYGSRFATRDYRRVLYYWHTVGNRLITTFCNALTNLNLTDVETSYKAVRTSLLRSIPIRSSDFRVEVELTFKLAKRGARIFEVPISYAGRSYAEGKKAGIRDGWLALVSILRWWLVDDLYDRDQYGSTILARLSEVPRFNRWMGDTLRPFMGDRVLEIGAGIGNVTRALAPRERYAVSDVNPHYLDYLRNFAEFRPYMEVKRLDVADPEDFGDESGRYDTVLCLNVLEHLEDRDQALRNLHRALERGGRAIVLVPQGPALYGSLDRALGHRLRYTRETLRAALEKQGFEVEVLFDFNRVSVPAWWLSGKVLGRRRLSRIQLKALDWTVWLARRIDRWLPWPGASLVAVARR